MGNDIPGIKLGNGGHIGNLTIKGDGNTRVVSSAGSQIDQISIEDKNGAGLKSLKNFEGGELQVYTAPNGDVLMMKDGKQTKVEDDSLLDKIKKFLFGA
jgi:hypothetical protein